MNTRILKNTLLLSAFLMTITSLNLSAQESTQDILESFVDSYRNDPMAVSATFGIMIGDEWWTVNSTRQQEAYKAGKKDQYTLHNFGPHEVELRPGMPAKPTWYFHLAHREVLDKINDKSWTASTAAMQSFGSDQVALELEEMEGYQDNHKDVATMYVILEHFWKKDVVEITEFKDENALPTHGVGAVSLYTMKDKRIAWFSMKKDEAANDTPGLERGQVPNLFIITKGRGKAILGEQEVDLREGMSVFVPQYIKHVLYNPNDEPMEGFVILFGDNVDYVYGQSYMDLLESQADFLGENEARILESQARTGN